MAAKMITSLLSLAVLSLMPLKSYADDMHPEKVSQLLANGGFESGSDGSGVPLFWSTYVPGATAEFRVVSEHARQGNHALSIRTTSDVKAILVSEPVPVAPGEILNLSVWCRCGAIETASSGSITLSVGFLNRDRRYFSWHRTQNIPESHDTWFDWTTQATVLPGVAYATFQIGINKMKGELWIDEAQMHTTSSLAVRFDLAELTSSVGLVPLPLILINRDPQLKGKTVVLTTEPGNHTQHIALSGERETPLSGDFTMPKRGKQTVRAILESEAKERYCVAEETVTIPEILRVEPLVPTHFCVEDGTPRLEGRLWVYDQQQKRDATKISLVLKTGESPVRQIHITNLPPNPVLYNIDVADATPGDYVLDVSVLQEGQIVASATQDWHIVQRASSQVMVGADGYLIVEGKPFFPIGMFNGFRLSEQVDAGFNVTHGYNAMATTPETVSNNQRAKDFLDETHKLGMKTLMLVTHGGHHRPVDDEFVRRVRMFRNHPALLAWDEEEGVARGEMPLSNLEEMHTLLKREAPEHPFMVGDARAPIFEVHDRSYLFPAEFMDLGMWWWYPFPLDLNNNASVLDGEEDFHSNLLEPPSFLTLAKTNKPIWVGIQAYKKPNRTDGRFPTPTEYRAQAYLSIIHGAKGLMYYVGSGSGGNGILNKPDEGNWNYLKELVKELRSLEDVIMSPNANQQIRVLSEDAPVSALLKKTARGYVLLAANRSPNTVRARFELDPSVPVTAEVLFEDRTAELLQNVLEDTFTPLGVHLYRFR